MRADGGPAAALRRLGRRRREHGLALRIRDKPVPERRQLEHAAAEPARELPVLQRAVDEHPHAAAAVRVGR